MDLIYYRGLNCYNASIINIVNELGLNYLEIFSNLWSENNFIDDDKFKIYSSKRIIKNLKKIGIAIEKFDNDITKMKEKFTDIAIGEFLIIGADIFAIPWHPVVRVTHDYHYFFVKKLSSDLVVCFDPVYSKKDLIIEIKEIFPAIFEIIHLYKIKVNRKSFKRELEQEVRAIIKQQPMIRKKILSEISTCQNNSYKIVALIKKFTIMVNNRYLFQQYLNSYQFAKNNQAEFFSNSFLLKWEAARNGLYKILVIKDNQEVIDEVTKVFLDLMNQEIVIAKKIIGLINEDSFQ